MSSSVFTSRPDAVINLPGITRTAVRGALLIAATTAPAWLPLLAVAHHLGV